MKGRERGWTLLAVAVIAFFMGRCSAVLPNSPVKMKVSPEAWEIYEASRAQKSAQP